MIVVLPEDLSGVSVHGLKENRGQNREPNLHKPGLGLTGYARIRGLQGRRGVNPIVPWLEVLAGLKRLRTPLPKGTFSG